MVESRVFSSIKVKLFLRIIIVILSLNFSAGIKIQRFEPLKVDDIEFWDIDNNKGISEAEKMSIKENIVNQLSTDFKDVDDNPMCLCPKIFGPVICDSLGQSHNNICLFLCEKRKNRELVPKKVLITLENADFKERCQL